jgi:hypothetical protein
MWTVDCDVAPISACHLLLGRPWQFDLDATHGGHYNCFSFVHKEVHHVFKPMLESGIESEVFASVKKKYHTATSKPKPRMALLQGEENDVEVLVPMLDTSVPKYVTIVDMAGYGTSSKDQNSSIKFSSLDNVLNTKKENNSPTMASNKYTSSGVLCRMANDSNSSMYKVNIPSKPRTALIQGREDDEPMAPQNISSIIKVNKCKHLIIVVGNNLRNSSSLRL